MKDSLGQRMKDNYEERARMALPRRTYTIIRIDGKAFHTYTKGCAKPFDDDLIEDMNLTAKYLCENISGAKLAYIQSDEISVVITDNDTLQTQAYFDGDTQKISSISASMATAKFNQLKMLRHCAFSQVHKTEILTKVWLECSPLAMFDSRCFCIPELTEVHNYFVWRQQDMVRNSIQMVGQANFSHDELQGKSGEQIQEMLFQHHQINWNDYDAGKKRGRVVIKTQELSIPSDQDPSGVPTYRTKWIIEDAPHFTKETDFVSNQVSKAWRQIDQPSI